MFEFLLQAHSKSKYCISNFENDKEWACSESQTYTVDQKSSCTKARENTYESPLNKYFKWFTQLNADSFAVKLSESKS